MRDHSPGKQTTRRINLRKHLQAGTKTIREGFTHYTPSAGIKALHEAIAENAGRRKGIQINPTQLVIRPGAKPALCIKCHVPQGAFYAFPNLISSGRMSDWLAKYLLGKAGVALLPGTSFVKNGEGYLRL